MSEISRDLLLAIMSMDAYNREYGAGIVLEGDKVGTATINDRTAYGIGQQQYQAWQDAGFYAVAYTITDGSNIDGLETDDVVISYRGTDDNFADPFYGYGIALGFPTGEQARFAAQFYQSVVEATTQDNDLFNNNIMLTGHSLGGEIVDEVIDLAVAGARYVKALAWGGEGDPLVLDLDGDGIETTRMRDEQVRFDQNLDLFAERTGWIDPDDGLLAIDLNGNGRIDDISELFGDADTGGLCAANDNRTTKQEAA